MDFVAGIHFHLFFNNVTFQSQQAFVEETGAHKYACVIMIIVSCVPDFLIRITASIMKTQIWATALMRQENDNVTVLLHPGSSVFHHFYLMAVCI